MAEVATRFGMAVEAIRLIILTAVRSNEAHGAKVGEFDLARAVWVISPHRTKTRREHRVPLSAAAVELVRACIDGKGADDLVFPSATGKPLTDVVVGRLLPDGVTVHGFRSSFRTWAGETTAFPREVIEHALAHRIGDAVEQAYSRGDLFQKRRALMEAWSTHWTAAA